VNGLLALQAFQNNGRKYDIVFMGRASSSLPPFPRNSHAQTDISMPIMNGMEASLKIRALEQGRKQKPAIIIALTGLASAEAQQEAMSSGMSLFMTKPVRFGELRKILGDWVS
jgi:CheY-like chemotaxis protein